MLNCKFTISPPIICFRKEIEKMLGTKLMFIILVKLPLVHYTPPSSENIFSEFGRRMMNNY